MNEGKNAFSKIHHAPLQIHGADDVSQNRILFNHVVVNDVFDSGAGPTYTYN